MKANFISTEGDYLEAKIEVRGHTYTVMDEFGGNRYEPGDEISIRLSELVVNASEWNEIFNNNPNKEKILKCIRGWNYFALGEVISVTPVVVDCGVMKIESPFFTNDPRCIGEFVGFNIDRLDAIGT